MGKHDDDGDAKGETPKDAKNELFAALGHLKNAAEILVAAADPAVRKAASDAEKALQKVGEEAEPVAQKLGQELGKMTRSLVDALEGKVLEGKGKRAGETAQAQDEETEIERLEREAKDAKGTKEA